MATPARSYQTLTLCQYFLYCKQPGVPVGNRWAATGCLEGEAGLADPVVPAPHTSSTCPCTELLGPGSRGAFSELGSQCIKENTGACGGGTPRCSCKHLFTDVRMGRSVSVHVDTPNTQTRVERVPPH